MHVSARRIERIIRKIYVVGLATPARGIFNVEDAVAYIRSHRYGPHRCLVGDVRDLAHRILFIFFQAELFPDFPMFFRGWG